MSLLSQDDELHVFPCPQCDQIVSTKNDVCKYCGVEIPLDVRNKAVEKQKAEIKELDIDRHKTIAGVGVIIFISGLGLLIPSIAALYVGGSFFIWSPVITIFGLGTIIYGLKGIWNEKRSK
jgi:hypothetical protein